MKFCLLVTVALDIFIKGKNNTSYLPWISPLSFFYAKSIYSAKLSGKPYFWLGGLLNYSYSNTCFILKCCKSTVLKFSYWPFVCRFRTLGTLGQFLLRISPQSVQVRENTDQNNSEYGHFLRSECDGNNDSNVKILPNFILFITVVPSKTIQIK